MKDDNKNDSSISIIDESISNLKKEINYFKVSVNSISKMALNKILANNSDKNNSISNDILVEQFKIHFPSILDFEEIKNQNLILMKKIEALEKNHDLRNDFPESFEENLEMIQKSGNILSQDDSKDYKNQSEKSVIKEIQKESKEITEKDKDQIPLSQASEIQVISRNNFANSPTNKTNVGSPTSKGNMEKNLKSQMLYQRSNKKLDEFRKDYSVMMFGIEKKINEINDQLGNFKHLLVLDNQFIEKLKFFISNNDKYASKIDVRAV